MRWRQSDTRSSAPEGAFYIFLKTPSPDDIAFTKLLAEQRRARRPRHRLWTLPDHRLSLTTRWIRSSARSPAPPRISLIAGDNRVSRNRRTAAITEECLIAGSARIPDGLSLDDRHDEDQIPARPDRWKNHGDHKSYPSRSSKRSSFDSTLASARGTDGVQRGDSRWPWTASVPARHAFFADMLAW